MRNVSKRTIGLALFVVFLLVAIGFFGNRLFKEGKQGPAGTLASGDEQTGAAFRTLTLFFGDLTSSGLVAERRDVVACDNLALDITEAMGDLVSGPVENLVPTLPFGTEIRHVFVDKAGMVYVDFSEHLVSGLSGGGFSRELMAIRSMARTLMANFDGLTHLQILIEGKVVPTLAGHLDTRRPLKLAEWD